MNLKDRLEEIKELAKNEIAGVKTELELNEIKAKYLGKKSAFNDLMKSMKDLSKEERPKFGKLTNEAKTLISDLLNEKRDELHQLAIQKQLEKETVDVTMPGRKFDVGTKHILTIVTWQNRRRLGYLSW